MPTVSGSNVDAAAKDRKDAATRGADLDLGILEASSVVAAIVVAPDGTILGANARMRRFLGLGDEAVGRQHAARRVPRRCRRVGRMARRRARRRPIEVELRGFDGATKVFRGDVIAQGDGPKRRLVGILVDGDDDKALRVAAQHSARMEALGSLTAGVAHDFNNLLTVLVGNLYLIGEELREQPRVFEKLKAARDAGKRGTELIKQLMTFARREELDVGTIDPAKVIGDLLPLLRRALGSRITLETTLQEHLGAVRASVAQLESAVVNLAVNARDAIEGRGRISIEVAPSTSRITRRRCAGSRAAGRYVAVSVRDTGSGIPPDALPRVFEPFFSTKRERGGTGLGLSMVRWFAEQAGGLRDHRERRRARHDRDAAVAARARRAHAADTSDRTMPLSTLPTGTERVVVLALDEALRATIHQTLEVLGYRVKVAAGAEDMLAAVAAEPTALLMVDGLGRGDADILIRRPRRAAAVADHRDARIPGARPNASSASAWRR